MTSDEVFCEHIYNTIIENSKKHSNCVGRHYKSSTANYRMRSFVWRKTSEGDTFWRILSSNLYKFIKNHSHGTNR